MRISFQWTQAHSLWINSISEGFLLVLCILIKGGKRERELKNADDAREWMQKYHDMERSTMGIDVWKRILTTFHRAKQALSYNDLKCATLFHWARCGYDTYHFHFLISLLSIQTWHRIEKCIWWAVAASATLRVMWRNCSSLLRTVVRSPFLKNHINHLAL